MLFQLARRQLVRYIAGRMWTGGHVVREIERSPHVVVVEETATKPVAWGFISFGVLAFFLYMNIPGAIFGAFFVMFGIYESVASTFAADRDRRVLIVKRRLGKLALEKQYKAKDVEQVFVRYTRKGSGLALKFRSGRTKDLTLSLGAADNLERVAGALTAYLYVPLRNRPKPWEA